MNKSIFGQLLFLAIYVLLQIFFANKITLFKVAFCFVYLNFLLTLPRSTDHTWLVLIGFMTGLMMDFFFISWGVHSMACTLVAYLRPYWLGLLTNRNERDAEINLREMGFTSFSSYLFLLIFIHHLLVFFIEYGSVVAWGTVLGMILASTLFTFVVIFLFSALFVPKTKN